MTLRELKQLLKDPLVEALDEEIEILVDIGSWAERLASQRLEYRQDHSGVGYLILEASRQGAAIYPESWRKRAGRTR